MAHLRDQVPRVTDINPAVPENLSRIIYKVMQKEPSARYRMADQLGHILDGYREQSQAHTASNAPASRSSPAPPSSLPDMRPRTGDVVPQRPPSVPAPLSLPENQPPESNQEPLAGQSAPTQQFGPAPVAPQPVDYGQKASIPQPGDSKLNAPWELQSGSSGSQPYVPPPTYPEPRPTGRLDVVTIVLAVLALIAVFGLIPLYIIVFRAWNGG